VIYVSNDQSAEEQQQYVREANMPWPVLRYSELGQVREVERWAGKGIPCLVALTPEGKLICHSYNGDEYLGPEQVVTAINNLVPMIKGTAPEILRARHRLAVMQYINVAGKNNRPPKPYFTQLNSSHYQTLEVEPKLPVVIEDELGQDLADNWLFLPAIENGKAVGKTVKIPLQFKHSLVER
jgi:hypothetical protein